MDGVFVKTSISRRFSGFLRLILLCCLFAAPFSASAEGAANQNTNASPVVAAQQPVVNDLVQKAAGLEGQVDEDSHSDSKLTDLRLALQQTASDLQNAVTALNARLTEVDNRLKQLGNPPGPGAPAESPDVASQRNNLATERDQINALISKADEAEAKANRTADKISEIRRDLFARVLSRQYDLGYSLNLQTFTEFRQELAKLGQSVGSWVVFVVKNKLLSALAATALALAVALVFLVGGRRVFGHLIEPDAARNEVSYLARLSVAFWSTLLPTLAVTLFLFTILYFYSYFGVFQPDIQEIAVALCSAFSTLFFVYRLSRAVLSPRLPQWRLLGVEPHAGHVLIRLANGMAFAVAADFVLGRFNQILHSPLSLTVAKSFVATVIVGMLVILVGLVKPFSDQEGRPRRWPAAFRFFLFLLGAVTLAAALLGYIGFARFLAQQTVITSAILITMYIGLLSARAISQEDAFSNTAIGQRLRERYRLDEATLDQMALAIGVLINLLTLLWGIPLILLQWGFHWADIRGWGYRLASEIRIGSVSFSLTGIASGILIFVIGYFISRWFQNWVDGTVMSRRRVDSGVRDSIRTAIGYAGVAIAALIGISVAGINLSSLALVAGALSLGIGFGLQNIVSNFVSGLILLAERPFKVGDWIISGSTSGIVKKISVRATEIETFQRQSVILPNSELINSAVGNWTHRNRLGRLEIAIGVAYGSDARRVHEILLDIAKGHPMVLKNPEPFVLFSDFGDSSLNFEVRVYLADVMNQMTVQNDIRFAILDAFAAEKIEIPFPQRDVWLRSSGAASTQKEDVTEAAQEKSAPAAPHPVGAV